MKKNLNKKLLLNKNTVASLEGKDMKDLKGGYISFTGTCITGCDHCTHPIYCMPPFTEKLC